MEAISKRLLGKIQREMQALRVDLRCHSPSSQHHIVERTTSPRINLMSMAYVSVENVVEGYLLQEGE